MIFTDRGEAGKLLGHNLLRYRRSHPVIVALPRGGVPIAYEIAKALQAPLDVLVARKLGTPFNPEFGIGAIAPEGVKILDKETIAYLDVTREQLKETEKVERKELERRIKEFRTKDSIPPVKNKTVILVDDGMATGVTTKAAVKAILKKHPRKVIIAIPVCSYDAVNGLKLLIRKGIDEVVCLTMPYELSAVSSWYRNFPQISDEEVIRILQKARRIHTQL